MTYDEQESRRLQAVNLLDILDSESESDFDDLVTLAARVFEVPISTITILDAHRQWFKAATGVSFKETPRDTSFCTHAIEQQEPLIVADATQDSRFSSNVLVTDSPNIAFYAGVPLRTSDDLAVGTFCIMDKTPRELSPAQIEILKILANQAMKLLELRTERNRYRDLVQEKERIYKQLKESEQRWQFALEGAGDGVWDWSIQTHTVIYSHQWKEMLGYEPHELDNKHETWMSLLHPEDLPKVQTTLTNYLNQKINAYKLEYRVRCKNQTYKWVLARGMLVAWDDDGAPLRMVGTHTDISHHKQSEELIWQQANFDALTGLPNRRMFFDRLKEEIKRASRTKQLFALMFIDLDGFKAVNDSFGHKAGDNLLIQLSQRVSGLIRQSDTFARLGGDEFTIIVSHVEQINLINGVAEKILAVVNRPYELGIHNATISASIGISVYPNHSQDIDTLISLADTAMYEAKAKGKNCWVLAN